MNSSVSNRKRGAIVGIVTGEHVFVILTRLGIALSTQHSTDRPSIRLDANRWLANKGWRPNADCRGLGPERWVL